MKKNKSSLKFIAEPYQQSDNKLCFYVKDPKTSKQVTEFNNDTIEAEQLESWEVFNNAEKLELQNYIANTY